jgi:hypothetical protein
VRPSQAAVAQAMTAGFSAAFEIGAFLALAGFVLAMLVIGGRTRTPTVRQEVLTEAA